MRRVVAQQVRENVGRREIVDGDEVELPPRSTCARTKLRPIRPKPLMPTLNAISASHSNKNAPWQRDWPRCSLRRRNTNSNHVARAQRDWAPASKCAGLRTEKSGPERKLRGRSPLRFAALEDRDDGRGLNPPSDERGPARVKMERPRRRTTTPSEVVSTQLQSHVGQLQQPSETPVEGGLRDRRAALRGEIAERERRVPQTQLARLAKSRGSPRTGRRRRACAPPEPVGGRRASCERGWRGRRSRAGSRVPASRRRRRAPREQHRIAGTRPRRERRRSPRRPSAYATAWRPRSSALRRRPSRPSSTRNSAPATPVVRISRCGERGPLTRSAAEQCAAKVGAPAARAPHDPARRTLERRAAASRTPASCRTRSATSPPSTCSW